MTDRNRFIAEKLEPEPTPVVQLWCYPLSPKKMWSYESGGGDREHRIFDEDPAAMVALIEAMVGAGWGFLDVCFVENGGRHCATFGKGEAYGGSTDRDLMIAVRDAAYKALGGE